MGLRDEEIRQEMDAIGGMVASVFEKLPGPISDIIRASTNATVDALIEGRARMVTAGWDIDFANSVCLSIINRNAQVAEQIAKSIQSRQQQSKGD
jgi:hypothetical protein